MVPDSNEQPPQSRLRFRLCGSSSTVRDSRIVAHGIQEQIVFHQFSHRTLNFFSSLQTRNFILSVTSKTFLLRCQINLCQDWPWILSRSSLHPSDFPPLWPNPESFSSGFSHTVQIATGLVPQPILRPVRHPLHSPNSGQFNRLSEITTGTVSDGRLDIVDVLAGKVPKGQKIPSIPPEGTNFVYRSIESSRSLSPSDSYTVPLLPLTVTTTITYHGPSRKVPRWTVNLEVGYSGRNLGRYTEPSVGYDGLPPSLPYRPDPTTVINHNYWYCHRNCTYSTSTPCWVSCDENRGLSGPNVKIGEYGRF